MPATPRRPFPFARHLRPASLAAGLLAAALAGCSPKDDEFPPVCPSLALLRDGGEITRFAGAGRDASDIVVHASIAAVPAKCKRDGAGAVVSTLNVEAEVTRGPAAQGQDIGLTYFVAVMDGERVVQEQDYPLAAKFPSGADSTLFHGDDIELSTKVGPQKSAAAYHIYVGFRLSPDELAYNRAHAP